jgi:hypothetical protein
VRTLLNDLHVVAGLVADLQGIREAVLTLDSFQVQPLQQNS